MSRMESGSDYSLIDRCPVDQCFRRIFVQHDGHAVLVNFVVPARVQYSRVNFPGPHHLLSLIPIICNLAFLIAFAAWAVLPCAYKVLTFQFPILNCVFGCTIGVLGSRASMWLSLWNVMLCATRPPRFGRLPLMCKVSVIIHFLRG